MATMADVARHAGVSVKTVSNVLSGYPHVREATRERVRASVDALGYEINVTAKIFRSGRSGVVGLSVPELGQPYFGELADEILAAARRHGLQVLIEPTGFTREGELAALRVPRGGLVDGLIFSLLPSSRPTRTSSMTWATRSCCSASRCSPPASTT